MRARAWSIAMVAVLVASLASAGAVSSATPATASLAYLADPTAFLVVGLGLLAVARKRRAEAGGRRKS